ncbi:MAG: hypothetical protein K2K01_00610, partial [Eubacterium sp.]|nr:hypothetical protein [Eubacterium sp.]
PYSADGNISDEDKALFEEYKKVLGELSPESLEEFLDIKYNEDAWNKLKSKYDILNQYEVDGNVPPEKIIQLDDAAFNTKRTGFDYSNLTGKKREEVKKLAKSGNAASMEFDGNIYFSHSSIKTAGTFKYDSYKGNYSLIGLNENRKFEVKDLGDGVPRQYDTEAKFLEFAATKKQPSDTFEITILSEKHICESCEGVVKQFKKMYPNSTVNIVSGKRGYNGDEKGLKTWKYRK